MKDKEKQIEEMAKHGCYDGCASGLRKFSDEYDGKPCKNMIRIASGLYEQGYRKLPKDSVVSREEYNNLKLEIQQAHNKGVQAGCDMTKFKEYSIEQVRKETAEKIFNNLLKEFYKRKSCGNADVVVYEIA